MTNLIRYANKNTIAIGFDKLDMFGNNVYTADTTFGTYKMDDILVVMYQTEKGANVITFNTIVGIQYVCRNKAGKKTYTYNLSEFKALTTNNKWTTVTQNLNGTPRQSIMRGDLNKLVL